MRASAIFGIPRFIAGNTTKPEGAKTEMFLDIARTTLPIDFQGREVKLEAHAYEDDTASYQAMALVHRNPDARAG